MATPTFLTGWEHGLLGSAGSSNYVDIHGDWANASLSTTTVRTGGYSLRLNPAAAVGYWEKSISGSAPNVIVARAYVYFASLPTTNALIIHVIAGGVAVAGVGYKQADGKFAPYLEGYGTSGGATISTGVWYRIDLRIDASTGTWAIDVQVDGTALTQQTGAFTASTFTTYKLGPNDNPNTMDMFIDDLVFSHTSGDYPLGEGYIRGYSPAAVGTHNLDASPSSAFFTDSAAAIQSTDTTTYQLIDDVPLSADETYVVVENDAGLANTHYLEYAFADSAESAEIDGVRGIVTLRQDSAANCAIVARIREGGSQSDIYSGDVNDAFRQFKAATFATKPSGGAWDDTALDGTTLRWGYTTDADGRVRLDSAMLEVAFGTSTAVAPSLRLTRSSMRW